MPRPITDGFKINRPQYAAWPRVLRPQPQTGSNALDARGVAGVPVGATVEDALPGVLQAGGEILERGLEKVFLASDLLFHQRRIEFRTEEDVQSFLCRS